MLIKNVRFLGKEELFDIRIVDGKLRKYLKG